MNAAILTLTLPRYTARTVADARELPPFVRRSAVIEDARVEISPIVADVAERGDAAVRFWSRKLDGTAPDPLAIPLDGAGATVAPVAREALALAAERISRFHRATAPAPVVDAADGLRLSRRFEPYRQVGVYVPGGRAIYPSSVLMLAIPAREAGVKRVVLTTPPGPGGTIPDSILYAAALAGVDQVFAIGGAQAIAALAYGTETVPAVDCIVGPGNRYVTAAKTLVTDRVAIDAPAGPSEIALLADNTATPAIAAADIVAQLEHDTDARALVVTPNAAWLDAVDLALAKCLDGLDTAATVRAALAASAAITVPDLAVGADIVSAWSPEHLVVWVEEPESIVARTRHAGAVFVGGGAPVALGDYVAGPSHTLPTGGAARCWAGVGTDTFGRWVSVIEEGSAAVTADLARAAAVLADLEGLPAHAASLRLRCKKDDE